MPRPVSWLPRLPQIRSAVKNSVRSHYDRKDLQQLFKLQPRAAADLMAMLPSVPIGRSHLVEREGLSKFLDRIHKAEDVTQACIDQRNEKEAQTRRKPRALVRRDQDVVYAASLAHWLTRGHLHIDFSTAQELFDALWRVASALQDDLDEFVHRYEPPQPGNAQVDQDRAGVAAMFEELEQLETAKKGTGHVELDQDAAGVLA